MHSRLLVSLVALLGAALASSAGRASAHASIVGPGFAGQNQLLTVSVGHGCEGADTVSVEIAIPSEITSVRAMPSVFGPVTLNADAAGVVKSVKYTKDVAHPKDELYYQFGIRVRLPDAPFTTLLFPTIQVCRAADGTETTVEWAATPEDVAAVPDGGTEPEPAPSLVILPPRGSGWNKYEAPEAISDLSIFDDAEIVWVGEAAYSSNPTTTAMIEDEADVEKLTKIAAGAEIWVKY